MTSCEEKIEVDKLYCTNPVCKPPPAGKVFSAFGSVKECLEFAVHGPDFDNRVIVPSYVPNITFGNTSSWSIPAGEIVNPTPLNRYQKRVTDNLEHIYESKIQPIGKCRLPTAYKGGNFVPDNTQLYGIATHIDEPAGRLINPRKSDKKVMEENAVGHDNYVISHNDYLVGEPINRKYNWGGKNPKTIKFGKPTPHYNNGTNMAQTLNWVHKTTPIRHTYLVSNRLDNFQNRFQPQIGKVFDPISDTLKIGPDHTFGIHRIHDHCGAGDLIHMRDSNNFLARKELERGWVACLRHHLKMANYHNFDGLESAFRFYDSDNTGYISPQNLCEACWKLNLPLDRGQVCLLMRYCCADSDEELSRNECKIDYAKFVNFLNWREKYDSLLPPPNIEQENEEKDEKVKMIQKQIDKAVGGHFTTNSLYDHTVPFKPSINPKRTCGIPTIRTDLPAPHLRRFSDKVDYGDGSNAFGLLNPSLGSLYGVYDRDYFLPRSQDEIRYIFDSIGVDMNNITFEKIWELAIKWSKENLKHNEDNKVSVEAFRAVLDIAQAEEIRKSKEVGL